MKNIYIFGNDSQEYTENVTEAENKWGHGHILYGQHNTTEAEKCQYKIKIISSGPLLSRQDEFVSRQDDFLSRQDQVLSRQDDFFLVMTAFFVLMR